jgi:hypothetical protein
MKTIFYMATGEAIPDEHAERRAKAFLQLQGNHEIAVSTDNFITAARMHVMDGVISHTEVQFHFYGDYHHLRCRRSHRLMASRVL